MAENSEQTDKPGILSWLDIQRVAKVRLECGSGLLSLLDEEEGGELRSFILSMRKNLSQELGFLISDVDIQINHQLHAGSYRIQLMGIVYGESEVLLDSMLAIDPGLGLEHIKGFHTKDPSFGLNAVWIRSKDKQQAESLGYTVVNVNNIITTHLSTVIRYNCYKMLGYEETVLLLKAVSFDAPNLSERMVETFDICTIQKVLRNLLMTGIPILDLDLICQILMDTAVNKATKNCDVLTSQVRIALCEVLLQGIIGSSREIPVIKLEGDVLKSFSALVKTYEAADFDNNEHEPESLPRLIFALKQIYKRQEQCEEPTVLLVPNAFRAPLFDLIHLQVPYIHILSFAEIPNNKSLFVIESINETTLWKWWFSNVDSEMLELQGKTPSKSVTHSYLQSIPAATNVTYSQNNERAKAISIKHRRKELSELHISVLEADLELLDQMAATKPEVELTEMEQWAKALSDEDVPPVDIDESTDTMDEWARAMADTQEDKEEVDTAYLRKTDNTLAQDLNLGDIELDLELEDLPHAGSDPIAGSQNEFDRILAEIEEDKEKVDPVNLGNFGSDVDLDLDLDGEPYKNKTTEYKLQWEITIDNTHVDYFEVETLKNRLRLVLSDMGAESTNIDVVQGSIIFKLLSTFKSGEAKNMAQVTLNIGKEYADNGKAAFEAKYFDKAVLDNKKLQDGTRTEEERSVELQIKQLELQKRAQDLQISQLDIQKREQDLEIGNFLIKHEKIKLIESVADIIIKARELGEDKNEVSVLMEEKAISVLNDGETVKTSDKLDLAKGYLEIGDNNNAQLTLMEIVRRGDPAQQKEAQEMLSTI